MLRRLFRAGLAAGVVTLSLFTATPADAFCGFYVGKAEGKLLNKSSQVVLVRDGDRTVVTMSNDYQGPKEDFALVVPLPAVIQKGQIHIGDRAHIERLEAYSTPRLVEYFDQNPCELRRDRYEELSMAPTAAMGGDAAKDPMNDKRAKALGVTVEAEYTVGEYDIVLLSAKQSEGLQLWLEESGYKVPARSARALSPYIKQDMKFFVAKVNLGEQEKLGFNYLRPIQIAYESKKFMLPIRLGMANAAGPQDLIIYAITKNGRVESTNYRTVKMPTDKYVPQFVRGEFDGMYQAVFEHAHQKEDRRAIFTEYVWDMGWCDPCSSDPLTPAELRKLGVFWLGGESNPYANGTPLLTRLHARYDDEHFPSDLVFQETQDRAQFQARYILQNPATGDLSCSAGKQYVKALDDRHIAEAKTVAELTGWKLAAVHQKMGKDAPATRTKAKATWWQNMWQ